MRSVTTTRTLAMLLALGIFGPAVAQETLPGRTVESLLDNAKSRNPEYAAMRLEAEAAGERVYPAGALPDPVLRTTFYEDLQEQLYKIIDDEKVKKYYYFEDMENSGDYPIDYRIEGKHAPLSLFGIPNRDKARLTTIILERLFRAKADFDSLLIFSDQGAIPKQDLARLSNAGGEMIASLDAETDFSRKLLRRINLN